MGLAIRSTAISGKTLAVDAGSEQFSPVFVNLPAMYGSSPLSIAFCNWRPFCVVTKPSNNQRIYPFSDPEWDFNSDGYPQTVPAGEVGVQLFFDGAAIHGNKTVTVEWDCAVNSTLVPGTYQIIDQQWADGTGVANIITSNIGNLNFLITRADNQSGPLPITNVDILCTEPYGAQAADTSDYIEWKSGRYIRSDFEKMCSVPVPNTSVYRRLGMLRNMNWAGLNAPPAGWRSETDGDVDVARVANLDWNEDVPPRVQGQLVALTKPERYWICIPIGADDSYVQAWIDEFKIGLGAHTGTLFIIEISNETWNFSRGDQKWAHYVGSVYAANAGVARYRYGNATFTAGSPTIIADTGEGAGMGQASSVFYKPNGPNLQRIKLASVSGDTLTAETNQTLNGTYPVLYAEPSDAVGPTYWAAIADLHRHKTILTAEFGTNYELAIGIQIVFINFGWNNLPVLAEIDPTIGDPKTWLDIISPTSYFGDKTSMQIASDMYDASAKDAAALAASVDYMFDVMDDSLQLLEDRERNGRAALDAVGATQKMLTYEGGQHLIQTFIANSVLISNAMLADPRIVPYIERWYRVCKEYGLAANVYELVGNWGLWTGYDGDFFSTHLYGKKVLERGATDYLTQFNVRP